MTNLPICWEIKDGKLYNDKGHVAFIYSERGFYGSQLDRYTNNNRYLPDFILSFIYRKDDKEFVETCLTDSSETISFYQVQCRAEEVSSFAVSWLVPGVRYYLNSYDGMETMHVVDDTFGFVVT
jgi:hypothetical protein